MKDLYAYFNLPKLSAEKIGKRNTLFFICGRWKSPEGKNYMCYQNKYGTPYRVTDGTNTLVFYIHKYSNKYYITEESTGFGAARAPFKTLTQAVDSLTLDVNAYAEKYGDYRESITDGWRMLLDAVKKNHTYYGNEKFIVKITPGTDGAPYDLKSISDYPAEMQEKFFKAALNNEKRHKETKKPASTPKNARKQPENEKKPEGEYTHTPETVKSEIEDLKAKIDRHYTAALEKWRAAHNLKPATA